MDENNGLSELRAGLDQVMKGLLDQAYERMEYIPKVAQYKLDHGLPIHQPEREEEVIGKARQYVSSKGHDPALAEKLMRLMIDHSREQEEAYVRQRQQG